MPVARSPFSRIPARTRTALAWTGLALSPVLLHGWIAWEGPYFVAFLAVFLPFGMLKRQPLPALGVLLLELVTAELVHLPPSTESGLHSFLRDLQTVTLDLAVAYIATTSRFRLSALAAGVALVVQLVVAAISELRPRDFENAFIPYAVAVLAAWLLGCLLRRLKRYRETRQAQAELQAAQTERLRIARELHDMIAHSIGVIAFQAGMGGRVIDTQPEEARKALHAIESTSRDTLTRLREVLGSLRRPDAGEPGKPPGLADLGDLAARTLDAGVRVDVRRRGHRRPLPPEVDLAAFRIIQEAVTNVVRHAGVARCEVVVEQRAKELILEVTDEGRGGAAETGYGIPGMHERVAPLRGEVTAGPRPDGGFRVSARIPLR
ncbi:sensor histidine kinase [Amycolatopsis magusensis]|uniref:histidine kinase n=1 Tax=Amycolatopsis magusensis TaxID=882444 RepID=A0ABS4Q2M8_9PSEU|nr:sensor histidine kinase [Amycolatopsis magusensis]MBP2185360.1 signal transduction histidine kinase [Amycolatopsis magusensis]